MHQPRRRQGQHQERAPAKGPPQNVTIRKAGCAEDAEYQHDATGAGGVGNQVLLMNVPEDRRRKQGYGNAETHIGQDGP